MLKQSTTSSWHYYTFVTPLPHRVRGRLRLETLLNNNCNPNTNAKGYDGFWICVTLTIFCGIWALFVAVFGLYLGLYLGYIFDNATTFKLRSLLLFCYLVNFLEKV